MTGDADLMLQVIALVEARLDRRWDDVATLLTAGVDSPGEQARLTICLLDYAIAATELLVAEGDFDLDKLLAAMRTRLIEAQT